MQVSGPGHGELLGVDVQLVGARGGGRVGRAAGPRRRHAVCADTWRSTLGVKRRDDRKGQMDVSETLRETCDCDVSKVTEKDVPVMKLKRMSVTEMKSK